MTIIQEINLEDSEGTPLKPGDKVIDPDGNEHIISFGKHRDIYGFGKVYGYYIPDGAIKVDQ